MRDEAAAGAPRRMFDVEHLVIENIFDGKLRHVGAVHAAIQQDLIGARIVAAKLARPGSQAPADVRLGQLSGKILRV